MISFAPMEGIGTIYYREVHHLLFPEGIDRYYTPFLSVYPNLSFRKRDMRELLPAQQQLDTCETIPQILAGKAVEIVWGVRTLRAEGFSEVNLNLGCPSMTVVRKGRGAGLLTDPDALDRTLEAVFLALEQEGLDVRLSVKSRLGLTDPAEFHRILEILNRYPLCEVILHPRVRKEVYSGSPHLDIFEWALENSTRPLAYNGDLRTVADIQAFRQAHPGVRHLMIGRGLVANPALARELAGGAPLSTEELRAFIRALVAAYTEIGTSEQQILCKLKEWWFYWAQLFPSEEGGAVSRSLHRLRMARNMTDYRNAEREVLRT